MIEDQEKGCSIVERRMLVSLMKSRQRTAMTRKIIARMQKVSVIASPPSTGGGEEEGVPPTKKPRLHCVSPTNASCSNSFSSSSTSMVSTDGEDEESLSSTNTTTEKETSPPTSIRELIATKGILPRLLQQTSQLPMSDSSLSSTHGPQRHGGVRLTEIMSKRKQAAALSKKHQGIKSPLPYYPSFQSTPIATFLRQSSWGSTDSACSSPFVSSQQTNAITRHRACLGGAHGAQFSSSFR